MAKRPVFIPLMPKEAKKPGVKEVEVDFPWHAGMALVQKQRNVRSLHDAFLAQNPGLRILECSRAATNALGASLSAFNLRMKNGRCVEEVFQGAKVFEGGIGPFLARKGESVWELRKRVQEASAGHDLVGFSIAGVSYPIKPRRLFYDFLYCHALHQNQDLVKELEGFMAFTDIAFNPARSVNCQAYAVALYRSLVAFDVCEKALKGQDEFVRFHPTDARRDYPSMKGIKKASRRRAKKSEGETLFDLISEA